MRFISRTPVRTFLIYPLVVLPGESITQGGLIEVNLWFLSLMIWGYLHCRSPRPSCFYFVDPGSFEFLHNYLVPIGARRARSLARAICTRITGVVSALRFLHHNLAQLVT